MAEHDTQHSRPAAGGSHEETFDRELSVRAIVVFLAGLAVLIGITVWVMWLMFGKLKRDEAAHDPQPSPLAEARAPRVPPEPRLQASPVQDMHDLRTAEAQALTSWGWVDPQHTIARVPVQRAMEMIVTSGLPEWPEPAPQAGTDGK